MFAANGAFGAYQPAAHDALPIALSATERNVGINAHDAAVPLTVTEEGTEHVTPCGAPVQLNDVVPLMPAPPIDKV